MEAEVNSEMAYCLDSVLIWPNLGICNACVPALLLNQPNTTSREQKWSKVEICTDLAI